MVELEDFDSGCPNGGFVVNHDEFVHVKMVVPIVFARVEETDKVGIIIKEGAEVGAFVAVAVGA